MIISVMSMKREVENMQNCVIHLSRWEYLFVEEPSISYDRKMPIILYFVQNKLDGCYEFQ